MATLSIEISDECAAALKAAGAHDALAADDIVLEQAIRWTVQATAGEIVDLAQSAEALNNRGIAVLADRIAALTRVAIRGADD